MLTIRLDYCIIRKNSMLTIRGPRRKIKRTRSPLQVKRANAFRKCCFSWRNVLTDIDRNLWAFSACDNKTGFNSFLSLNLYRAYLDLDIVTRPYV